MLNNEMGYKKRIKIYSVSALLCLCVAFMGIAANARCDGWHTYKKSLKSLSCAHNCSFELTTKTSIDAGDANGLKEVSSKLLKGTLDRAKRDKEGNEDYVNYSGYTKLLNSANQCSEERYVYIQDGMYYTFEGQNGEINIDVENGGTWCDEGSYGLPPFFEICACKDNPYKAKMLRFWLELWNTMRREVNKDFVLTKSDSNTDQFTYELKLDGYQVPNLAQAAVDLWGFCASNCACCTSNDCSLTPQEIDNDILSNKFFERAFAQSVYVNAFRDCFVVDQRDRLVSDVIVIELFGRDACGKERRVVKELNLKVSYDETKFERLNEDLANKIKECVNDYKQKYLPVVCDDAE